MTFARFRTPPAVSDRNRGAMLPSGLSDESYALLADPRPSGTRVARRPAERPPARPQSPSAEAQVTRKAFPDLGAVRTAGFRRVATGLYADALPSAGPAVGGARAAHRLWELRQGEDGGVELVRTHEERAVDLRAAAIGGAAGAGTQAALEAGILRVGSSRQARVASPGRRTAAPKFQVTLLRSEDGRLGDRVVLMSEEVMDLSELARLATEIDLGEAELTHDTWSDGHYELRVRGPGGELIHDYDATHPGEIGGERGAKLIGEIGAALSGHLDGATDGPPADLADEAGLGDEGEPPLPLGEADEMPPLDEGGAGVPPPAGDEGVPVSGRGVGARRMARRTPAQARAKGPRVRVVRHGQVADAVVLMVEPQADAVRLLFEDGVEETVPGGALLDGPDVMGGELDGGMPGLEIMDLGGAPGGELMEFGDEGGGDDFGGGGELDGALLGDEDPFADAYEEPGEGEDPFALDEALDAGDEGGDSEPGDSEPDEGGGDEGGGDEPEPEPEPEPEDEGPADDEGPPEEEDGEDEPVTLVAARGLRKSGANKMKYVECPECEAGFPVVDKRDPLPPHRAFRGPGLCPGSGKPGI